MTKLIIDPACLERGCACNNPMVDTDGVPVNIMDTVQLLVKDQYGNQVLYPHNKTAELFASIAGTKTLTIQTVKHIMQLGYSIEYVHGEIKL